MTRLWVRLMKHHRIAAQRTEACAPGDEREVLREICRELDVPAPMWLDKNDNEYERFRRTAFTADNFVEHTSFDRLEIEFIDEEKGKGRADPRNVFDEA